MLIWTTLPLTAYRGGLEVLVGSQGSASPTLLPVQSSPRGVKGRLRHWAPKPVGGGKVAEGALELGASELG
jgi:hypothetical protein